MLRDRARRACRSLMVLGLLSVVPGQDVPAQITLDGTLGPAQTLTGPNFTIDSTMGQIRGTNLFHSFGKFNVLQGESATFTNSLQSQIANVLSRVTGGERSFIDGLVRSDIAGANLYLINPSGVAFGPNASLNVSGAFHVSTADYLRLADGGVFYANPQTTSNLTIAPPAAFGFLSQAPVSITFDQTLLEAPQGKTLSVIGGDVQVAGGTLRARGGLIQIASVASPGEVVPGVANGVADLQMNSFTRLGQVRLSDEANATTSGPAGAGTVLIRSGRLVLDSGTLNSNTTGAGNGASIGIDVRVTEDAVLDNIAQMFHFSEGAGRAGDARVTVGGKLQLKNGSTIEGGANSTGLAGNATINAGVLEIFDAAGIVESTSGPRPGGNLDVTAGSILISGVNSLGGTGLFTGQFSASGTGAAGRLSVNAGSIEITGTPGHSTGIQGATSGPGAGGPVQVNATSLKLVNNASISNTTFGAGQGGPLTVRVDGNISITGSTDPNVFTGLFANTFGTGNGGSLEVVSKSLDMAQRGSIQAGTFWFGDAAGATVTTGRLEITSGSGIFTSALFGAGNAGKLNVTADSILIKGIRDSLEPMTNSTQFTGLSTSTGTFGKRGGDLTVTADSIVITDKGSISSVSLGAGAAGAVRINANTLLINERAAINASAVGSGRGGDIVVQAANVTVSGAGAPLGPADPLISGIGSQSQGGSGAAGDLTIATKNLQVLDGARVTTQTYGPGSGGNISLQADNVHVSGINSALAAYFTSIGRDPAEAGSVIAASTERLLLGDRATGNAGNIRIVGGTLQLDAGGAITSRTSTPGRGGMIDIQADRMVLTDRSSIQGLTLSSGDAGSATVKTGSLDISNGSGIFTNALQGSGNAGNVTVTADSIVIRGIRDSIDPGTGTEAFTGLSTATGPLGKRGGDVGVTADSVVITDKGSISSLSTGAGDAGAVRINANTLLINERATVNASASGSGRGGNIIVQANDLTVSGAGAPAGPLDPMASAISSQSQGGTGAAGDVSITAMNLQVLDGAKVSTQTFGPGSGGNISLQADNVLVSGINSALAAHLTSTGQDPAQARSAIAASSERLLLGDGATGNAGNIRIAGGALQLDAGGAITSRTSTPGRGGTIDIQMDRVTLFNEALVSVESVLSPRGGKAGDIFINARDLVQIAASAVTSAADNAEGGAINVSANRIQLDPGTTLSARASGAGNAGNITLAAGDSLKASGSSISTEATQSDGGNITLMAPTMVHLVDTTITTSVGTGQGKGGNIAIDPQFVILDHSELRADAFGGPGGNIRIVADVFFTQNSILSASSALSAPGLIDIEARITDISGNVSRLPEGISPVPALLRASCASRLAGGSISSLVVAGREGLPPDPEGLLPSPLLAVDAETRAALSSSMLFPMAAANGPVLMASDCSGFRRP